MSFPLFVLMILAMMGTILFGCREDDAPEDLAPVVDPKGLSISPRSFDLEGFTDYFAKAQQAGDHILWAGDWIELGYTSGGPADLAQLGEIYHLTPVYVAQFFSQSGDTLLRPLNDSIKAIYLSDAIFFAQRSQPAYLGLGIEVNLLYEHSPADFQDFVDFYPVVRDSVLRYSPSTMVFTVFQLEQMKGLRGGLFGGVNDTSTATWQLMDLFPSELAVFTSYPGLIFTSPDSIPTDYYTEISRHTSKPVLFSELGWHSAAEPWGWESSEAEQARFVTRWFQLSSRPDRGFMIWSFLYDPVASLPFNSMGLCRRSDGVCNAAWQVWVAGSW